MAIAVSYSKIGVMSVSHSQGVLGCLTAWRTGSTELKLFQGVYEKPNYDFKNKQQLKTKADFQ